MSDQVKVWSPQDVVGNVQAKITQEFVNLIPPEAFRGMVDAQMKRFFQDGGVDYNRNRIPSDFEVACKNAFHERAKAEIAKILNEVSWAAEDSITRKSFNEWLDQNGVNVMKEIMRQAFTEGIKTMFVSLTNNRY